MDQWNKKGDQKEQMCLSLNFCQADKLKAEEIYIPAASDWYTS